MAELNMSMPPGGELPAEIQQGLERSVEFLEGILPHLGRLYGIDATVRVGQIGQGAGMATDPESGDFIFDPRFFLERDYTPDEAVYGGLHEFSAHIRRVIQSPDLTKRVNSFCDQGPAQAMFTNILEDVAGNNFTHAMLPRMTEVGKGLYRDKLFEGTDYTDLPRHVQFLYKIIREEMVPDEAVTVFSEVDDALASLRDFQGQGDVIKYSAAVAKSAREAMSSEERFKIWQQIIYPVYEQLVEQDRQDPQFQNQSGDSGEPQPGESQQGQQSQQPNDGQSGAQQSQDGSGGESQVQPSDRSSPHEDGQKESGHEHDHTKPSSPTTEQGKGDRQRFSTYYEDYWENRHPEPLAPEEMEEIQQQAEAAQAAKRAERQPPQSNHEQILDQRLREETGHTLQEQRLYDAEIIKWQEAIDEMREVFQSVINERIAQKRAFSRRTFSEGAVLDPDRLVQSVIDVRNHIEEPEAFRDYETRKGQTESIGKTDYIFAFDISGSMAQNGKSKAAASSAVIGLEGLSALQRDIEEAEATNNMELDLDIRTAIYTFGEDATCLKPLSTKISPKERLDSHAALSNPNDGATRDYLAVEAIEALPDEPDRRRIVIVISDGETYDPSGGNTSARTRRSIDRLRGKGWFVYGISIGSDEAERLYQPTARRVDDPMRVPATLQGFIEATIS